MKNLPKTIILCQFANYVKNVIERGLVFNEDQLINIIKELDSSNMTSQEIK